MTVFLVVCKLVRQMFTANFHQYRDTIEICNGRVRAEYSIGALYRNRDVSVVCSHSRSNTVLTLLKQ